MDHRCNYYCTKYHTRLWVHAARKIKVKDLPASGYPVYIEAEVFHSHCLRSMERHAAGDIPSQSLSDGFGQMVVETAPST